MDKLKNWLQKNIELCFWVTAIILLFFMQAEEGNSLCFFHWIGINSCPGCGIGHSIHSALHLKFAASIHQHPLGIISVLIIFNRIRQLFSHPNFTRHDTKSHYNDSRS